MKKTKKILAYVFIALLFGTVAGKAAEIELVYGGGKTAASVSALEGEALLVTAVYGDEGLCDVSLKRGVGDFRGGAVLPGAGEYVKAMLFDGNITPKCIASEISYPSTGICDISLAIGEESHKGFVNGDKSEVSFFIPSLISKGTGVESYGIGEDWEQTLSSSLPEINANYPYNMGESVNLSSSEELDFGVKKTKIKAYNTTLQFKTPFSYGDFFTEDDAETPARVGLPKWGVGAKGEQIWYWVCGSKPEVMETAFLTDSDSSSRCFNIIKNDEGTECAFMSKSGVAKNNVSRVLTEYDIKIRDVEGTGLKIGNRGGIVFKKESDRISVCFVTDMENDKDKIKSLPLSRTLTENKWYKIQTIFKNTLTDDGYLGETEVYIDGVFEGSFSEVYNTDFGLYNANTVFDSFSDTTFDICIDNYSISYMQDATLSVNGEAIDAALESFSEITREEILDYLYLMFDPESGAFYHAASARELEGSEPLLEATAFAFEIMLSTGLLTKSDFKNGTYPSEYAQRVVAYTKSLQDEDGYFYQNCWGKDVSDVRKNRDLSWGKQILSYFGAEPNYAYPDKREETDASLSALTLEESLSSTEDFKAYLDSLDWTVSGIWSTGDKLSSGAPLIKSAGLFEYARNYIVEKQNTETGLWADGVGIQNVNGAMKLANYFDKDFPYPNVNNMVDSVLLVVEDERNFNTATAFWNPIELLKRAKNSAGDSFSFKSKKKLFDALPQVLETMKGHIESFKKDDGGYSSRVTKGASSLMGYVSSLGKCESDMDATIIIGIRLVNSAYLVAEKEAPKAFSEYKEDFLARLSAKGDL